MAEMVTKAGCHLVLKTEITGLLPTGGRSCRPVASTRRDVCPSAPHERGPPLGTGHLASSSATAFRILSFR